VAPGRYCIEGHRLVILCKGAILYASAAAAAAVGAAAAQQYEEEESLHGHGDRRRRRLNTDHLHRLGGHLAHSRGGQANLRGDMASV